MADSSSSRNRARTRAIRARMAAAGEKFNGAARVLGAGSLARRTTTATATYEPQHGLRHGWRLTVDDIGYHDGASRLPWPVGVEHSDAAAFLRGVQMELAGYGWDVASRSIEEPIATRVTLELVRNDRGLRLDEVMALHSSAAVTFSTAHEAYIVAVADAVAGTGVPVGDIEVDHDEPRSGSFSISARPKTADPDVAGNATWIRWHEDRGWEQFYYRFQDGSFTDHTSALGGDLGLVALPQDVAVAVLNAVEVEGPTTVPRPARPRPGYEPDPARPGDSSDLTDVSPALERSLVSYVNDSLSVSTEQASATTPAGQAPTLFTEPAAQARRVELDRLRRWQLIAMLRRGVTTADGRVAQYAGGAHPPETWRKDELVTTVLRYERPELPWAAAPREDDRGNLAPGAADPHRLDPEYEVGPADPPVTDLPPGA